MNRGATAAIAAAIATACVLVVDDSRDTTSVECRLRDGGLDTVSPNCAVHNGFDGNIGFGDANNPVPEPGGLGSGEGDDNGTSVLVLLRVDQGTANIASALQDILQQIAEALENHGFGVVSVAVAEMYAPDRIWASRRGRSVPPALASVVQSVSSSRTAALPTGCPTVQLHDQGVMASSWNQAGTMPFVPAPAALLVVLIDSGSRPQPLDNCPASAFSVNPVSWFPLQRRFQLAQTRFLMIATPESGDSAAMRSHCLGIPNFPTAAIDVLAPSSNRFFDPWSAQMNSVQPGLATRVDLCDAVGGSPAVWNALARDWRQALDGLR